MPNWVINLAATHPVLFYGTVGVIVIVIVALIVVTVALYGHFPTDDET